MHAERTLGGVRALGAQNFMLVHAPVHPACAPDARLDTPTHAEARLRCSPTRVLLTNQHKDAVSFGVLPSPSLRLNAHAQHGHIRISAQSTSPDPPPPPPATRPAPTTLTTAPKHHTAHIWQIKIATPALMLFCNIPRAFLHFWQYVKGTAFGERLGYARLRVYFAQAWKADALELEPGWCGGGCAEGDWVGIYKRLRAQEESQSQSGLVYAARARRCLIEQCRSGPGAYVSQSSVCPPAHADIGRGVQDFVERWKFWGQRLDEIAMNDEASEETRGIAKKMKEMMITTEA
ncbi:hypothetical protein BJ912DRAFT_1062399 [Pholiota molesta]|nr:hypothetical protein BJ912DRAFT_1062399 [Pholiota molesta]